jgi:benzaldehyde dehydrogenase (NAD)
VLRRAGALWEEHAEEVEGWLVREAGSVPAKAATETHVAAQECYEAARCPQIRPARSSPPHSPA